MRKNIKRMLHKVEVEILLLKNNDMYDKLSTYFSNIYGKKLLRHEILKFFILFGLDYNRAEAKRYFELQIFVPTFKNNTIHLL